MYTFPLGTILSKKLAFNFLKKVESRFPPIQSAAHLARNPHRLTRNICIVNLQNGNIGFSTLVGTGSFSNVITTGIRMEASKVSCLMLAITVYMNSEGIKHIQ